MAWACQHCNTDINEDNFDVCWNCGCVKGDTKPELTRKDAIACLRCESQMTKLGPKAFHEGTRWGAIGNLGELFVNKQLLDMYVCESCGKVEFFMQSHDQ